MTVERHEKDLVFGTFLPGPGFPNVELLFRRLEEAVEAQAVAPVDELDLQIQALGPRLHSTDSGEEEVAVRDMPIWGDGNVTLRTTVASFDLTSQVVSR